MASQPNITSHTAFSDNIQKMDVFGDGNERPLVIADRSVIYLPMLDKKHYVVFSGASIFQDGKGLPDDSKMKNNDETGNIDLNEFMTVDKKLFETIKAGIKQFTEVQSEKETPAPAPASEKVKPVFEITNGKNKGSEDLFTGEWKENFEINIKDNEDQVKKYLKKVYKDIKTFLDTNKTLLNNKHFDKKRELLGSDVSDEKISVLVNEKYTELLEKVDTEKAYYIFKVAGDFLDTQPFGGFDLPPKLAEVYKTKEKFLYFLLDSFKNMKTDNVYGTEIGEGKITLTTSELFKKRLSPIKEIPETKKDTSLTDVGFHLPSSNKNNLFCEDSQNCEKKLKLQDRVKVENKPIDLGDSNLTKSKYTPAKGTTPDLENDLKNRLKDKYVLMSNFKIQKSRTGGPLMNTQIFKNESTEEVDGMMIIFDSTFESKIDKKLLHELVKSDGNYKLLKGDGISPPWYEEVTTGENLEQQLSQLEDITGETSSKNLNSIDKKLNDILKILNRKSTSQKVANGLKRLGSKMPKFRNRFGSRGGSRKKNKRTIKRRNVSRKRNLRRS